MGTSSAAAAPRSTSRPLRAAGMLLLGLGLLGHLYAAHVIGGSRMAYTHHVAGFFLILVVTGAVIAALGWRFWRARPDVTLLIVGVVQALFGVFVALQPFRAAGHG